MMIQSILRSCFSCLLCFQLGHCEEDDDDDKKRNVDQHDDEDGEVEEEEKLVTPCADEARLISNPSIKV